MPGIAVLAVGGLVATISLTSVVVGTDAGPTADVHLPAGRPPAGAAVTPEPAAGGKQLAGKPNVATLRRQSYATWATEQSQRTGVPARALEAYAVAVSKADVETPQCHLSWATLAGIGYVESRNGDLGGGLRPSGRPDVAIYGVRLDGTGPVAVVPDTDQGSIDRDPTLDRAVGPLQFLPSTWTTWGSDGDGNGVLDTQDVDDAALTAARYLCAAGDLRSAAGWTAAVLSYNRSSEYLSSVYAATEQIASSSAPAD